VMVDDAARAEKSENAGCQQPDPSGLGR
jgi:hypothetical protein